MSGVLGNRVDAPAVYSPDILEPISRHPGRVALGIEDMQVNGADVWHLYELGWLEAGAPVSYTGVLLIPASSDATVESKSLKLYLNSLNFHSFDSREQAETTIIRDLSALTGSEVGLSLFAPTDLDFITEEPEGILVDSAGSGSTAISVTDGVLVSHLLRSLCPVTAQPDWATLVVEFCGATIPTDAFRELVLSFRRHQEFHEQCVERIFLQIKAQYEPEELAVVAYYQRRGGIDITPWRNSAPMKDIPLTRMSRQ